MTVPVYLNHLGIVCALGSGKSEVRAALLSDDHDAEPDVMNGGMPDAMNGGVVASEGYADTLQYVGRVATELVDIATLPASLQSRNNALLLTALAEIREPVMTAIQRFGSHRVAVILGTSTSGIGESEQAIAEYERQGALPAEFHLQQQEMASSAQALAVDLGITGPAYVISTACSSSAKALISAGRLLRAGLCDAVIAGGADSLCRFTVAGFSALEAVSAAHCNPFSANRCGINIGEAAALFLLTLEPGPVRLAGWGESSDAHHISAPEPEGRGAVIAMKQALASADVQPGEIDYINLHGTATRQNDAMESRAVHAIFGAEVFASSSKPLTGHTLGAAGALEAAFSWLLLQDNPEGCLPLQRWDGVADPSLPALRLVSPGEKLGRHLRYVLSNSFAFGGSNVALLLAKAG